MVDFNLSDFPDLPDSGEPETTERHCPRCRRVFRLPKDKSPPKVCGDCKRDIQQQTGHSRTGQHSPNQERSTERSNPRPLSSTQSPPHVELLACPNCATTIRSAKTIGIDDSKTIRCKKCQLRSSLGEWRLNAPDEIVDAELLPPTTRALSPPAAAFADPPPPPTVPPDYHPTAAQSSPSQQVVVNNYIQQTAAMQPHVVVRPYKSRSVATLLALFLGGLGAHHFYRGNTLLGLLYVFFCWTFIPAIIAVVEAIYYCCIDDDTFNGTRTVRPHTTIGT